MFLQFFVSNGLAQCEGVDVTPALSSVFWDATSNMFKRCLTGGATTGTINFTENTPDTYNSAIASYSINWGDGTSTIVASTVPWTSSGSQVNTSDENWGSIAHSYAAGQYTLVYTLTTSTGCTIVRNYTVFVGSTPASPGVSFPPNASSCAPVTLPITLSNFSNNPTGTTYVLTFNDNSTPQTFTQQTIPTVINHTFTTSSCGFTSDGLQNVFGATLIATNPCGQASGSASNLQVSIAPTAAITGPQEACVGSAVLYNNTSDTGETVNGASCGTDYGFVWEVLDASGNVIAPGSEYSLLSGFLGSNFADPNDYLLWTNGSVQFGLAFNTSGTYTVRLKARNSCPDESVMFQTILINSQSCPCVGASPTATITPVGSTTFCQGGSVVLNANTGTGFMYQWYNNASPISGATSSSYTANASGSYSVGVTNTSSCSATSSATNVVVNPSPTFTTQPTSSNVCVGGTTNQMCVAYTNGTGTPTYQWYSNSVNNTSGGTAIPSANSNCYTPPSSTAGTKYYYAVINLSGGGCSSITSNTASVIITPDPVIATQPAPNQTICVGGSSAPLTVSLQAATGIGAFTYQWYANTTATNSGGTVISGASSLTYNTPVFNTAGTFYYYCVVTDAGNGCGNVSSQVATVVVVADPTVTAPIATQTLCQTATPAPLTVTASGGTGTLLYQWYSNTVNTSTSGTSISGATANSYSPPTASSGTFYYYCVVTTAASGCSVTSVTSTVVVNPGPTFTTQPAATQSVCVGGTTNQMCVTYANGTGTPAYQWYSNTVNSTSNGTAVSGATASCFTPPSTTSGTTYYYSIINLSGGGCSSITSNTAEVIVIPNPVLTAQPLSSQTICVGGTIPTALSVAYTGGIGTATYQWFSVPVTPISGASSNTYTPPAFTTPGTFGYYATITLAGSGCGSTTSQVATVVVVADPTATISSGASYCQNAGTVVALSVVVSNGQGTPSYQWYSNTVNSNVGGTAISGATAISYSPSVAATGTTYYYCMISQSGTNCSVNSPTAQIIVTPAPTFTIQPVSTQSVCVGVTTTQLSVAYSNGTGAASYQWYSNTSNIYNGGVPISAATSSVYTPPSSSAGTTYYYCIVSFSTGGGCSMINSNIAQVIVDPSLCGGNTAQANFSMDTQGCSPYVVGPVNTSVLNASCANTTYQWNITPSNSAFAQFVAGTNSSSTSPVIQFIEPGNYTVTLTLNSCGIITTASQQIVIETTPNISLAAATSCLPYSYAPGVNVAEVSVISNSQVNNLNWSVTPSAGVQIFNGSTTTPTIQFNQSGTYTIQLEGSNTCGTNTGQAQVEVIGAAFSYYQDSDSDLFGNTNVEIVDCIQPVGYVLDNTDCDDSNAAINPNAEEIGANGIDENCDGQIDNSIFELNAKISLYPNPTRSELNIQINSSIIGNDLYIFDAVGKLVFKQQLLSTQTTIPVSNFADGNYVVKVNEVVKRLVVQH